MTTGFTLRLATADDIPLMVFHRRRMFEDMGDSDAGLLDKMEPEFARWAKNKLQTGEFMTWFAVDPSNVVAAGAALWLMAWIPGPNSTLTGPKIGIRPYLLNVYTEPAYRRLGLARLLVTEIVEYCRAQGYTRLSLHASREGRPLYESLGFEGTNEMKLSL